MENITAFEEFWLDHLEMLEGKIDKETAEIIWNSAVVNSMHNFISFQLQNQKKHP